ncbi:MAG: hypothetical protein AB1600_04255 [Bacteroidota bacterium]
MKSVVSIFIVAALLLFNGCMMVSMFGGGHDNQSPSSITVQKEITSNGVKAEATFPPLTRDKEATFKLKVIDGETGKPLSNVGVWFHATYTHQPMEHQGGMMEHSSDHSRMEEQHGINYDAQLTDTTSSGIFSVPFTPTQPGEYTVAFHLVPSEEKPEESIIVEQKLNVIEESHSSGGMMGSFGSYAIIAGAAMGALMVYFWVSGNAMF